MSDKNFDIDDILGESKGNVGDASTNAEKPKKSDVDEIDELLASLKNRPKRRRPSEAEFDSDAEAESAPAPIPEAEEVASVIADESEAPEEPKEEEDAAIIPSDNDDIKKHFGKDNDIEDEFDEDEDEDEEEDVPVRRSSNKNSAPDDEFSSGKKRSGRTSGRKKKKKRGIGFNGSIFGGIILVTIILTVSLLLAVSGLTLGMEFYGIGKDDNEISFNIPEGSSNEQIADLLVENGIIKNKKLFLYTIKFMHPTTIYPGDITLQPSKPYSDIINALAKQRERFETVTITFTEGEYLTDVAKKLEENNVCTAEDFLFEFNKDLKDMGYTFESYLTPNKNVFYAREGYLFPDTYEFYVNDNAFNITKILREHYDSKISDDMYKKMNDQGLTLNETITLASIVQLEAANVDEMPKVASVFLNRLRDSDTFPMLQSDTTYNYIEKVIKASKSDSEDLVAHYTEYYDTYAIDGLPAGPICNPGLDAINAVLNPAETDYYYFCNDLDTGETFYAETLDEHEKNLVKAGRGDQVVDDKEDNKKEDNEENNEEYNENW